MLRAAPLTSSKEQLAGHRAGMHPRVLHCLPVGMVGNNPAGTGTVMRPPTPERYAKDGGFSRVEVLPIFFFRVYRLHS